METISAVGAHIDETVTADLDETAGGPVVEEAVETISAVAAHVDETIAHSAQAGRSVSGAPEDAGGLVAEPVVKDLEEASVADPTRLVEGAVTPVDPRLKRDGSELSTVATSPLLVAEPVPVGSASLGSAQAPRQSPQPAQLAPSGPPTRAPVKPSAPGWTLQARPAQLAPSASGGRVDLFTFEPTLEAGPARVQVPSWPTQDQPVVPGTPLAHTTGSLGGAGPGQSDNFTALVEGLAALLALLLLGVLGIATLTARSRFHAPLVSPG